MQHPVYCGAKLVFFADTGAAVTPPSLFFLQMSALMMMEADDEELQPEDEEQQQDDEEAAAAAAELELAGRPQRKGKGKAGGKAGAHKEGG
jgi:hypothetical protein